MSKRITYLLGIPLLLLIIQFAYEKYDKGKGRFYTHYIVSDFHYQPEWEIEALTADQEASVRQILNQPYYYLGKGGQAYAFLSQDGQYVIKFLKFKYLRPRFSEKLLSMFPLLEDLQINEMQRRKRKFYDLYQGYKWSYDQNKESTGLIYLHLNPTFRQFGWHVFYDKLNLKHTIDLDQVAFIVQKKGELLNAFLTKAFEQNDLKRAQEAIFKTIDMYLGHYAKGFYDRDYGVIHNAGITEEGAIHIDLGKMTYDPKLKEKSFQQEDLRLVLANIENWIKEKFPEQYPEMKKVIQMKLSASFDS